MQTSLFAENQVVPDLAALEESLVASYEQRLKGQHNFTEKEVSYIGSFDQRLLPDNLNLDFQSLENLRVLANFSQIELKRAREISSHRKIVGPFIVLLKRISWPFVKIHLEESFKGLAELSAWTLKTLSHNLVEINELKKRVSDLEKRQN